MTLGSRLIGALAAFSLLLLTGCGGGGSSSGGSKTASSEYRIVNASPDTASLDVYVNGAARATALPYGASMADFRRTDAGDYDIGLRPTGETIDAWTETVKLEPNQSEVVVAFGLQSFGEEFAKRLRLAAIQVNRSTPNGNKARLVVVNTFLRQTGFDNFSVDFKNPGDNPQNAIDDIGFGTARSVDLDSGPQSFEFRLSGADEVIATRDLDLQPGKVYLVLLGGIEGGSGAQAPDIKTIELTTK